MTPPRCHRCMAELDYCDVTSMSDPEPVYAATSSCDCPGPRCSLCSTRIDTTTRATSPGECPNPDCTLWARIVPLPIVA